MNEISKQENNAIRYMARFNAHCPLIGSFWFAVKDNVSVCFDWAGKVDKQIQGTGATVNDALKAAKEQIAPLVPKLKPTKDTEDKDQFLGERACAAMILAEK